MSDEDIAKGIASDPDAAPDMSNPHPGIIKRARGKQIAPTKTRVTLRLSGDIIEHFKADGPGWQTRLNEHLERTITRDSDTGKFITGKNHRRKRAAAIAGGRKTAKRNSKKIA